MNATVCLLSGGMDSTTLLAHLLEQGEQVCALGVHYGQRHARELDAARAVADHYRVDFDVADLSALRPLLTGSALTDDVSVPHGHYAEETMRATVVPNRNAIMLSVAAGVAVSRGAHSVATAVHAGDHFIYPDCRPEFITVLSAATALGTDGFGNVSITAPFVAMTKTEICARAAAIGAPLHLTWSCYEGGDIHCGACGTCYERREAFTDSGTPDPTAYAQTPEYDHAN